MSLVLGCSSGSSFDGIDVVVADIENGDDGFPARPKSAAAIATVA